MRFPSPRPLPQGGGEGKGEGVSACRYNYATLNNSKLQVEVSAETEISFLKPEEERFRGKTMGDQGDPQQVRQHEPLPNLYDLVSPGRSVRMAFTGRGHPVGGNRLSARAVPGPFQFGNMCSQARLFRALLLSKQPVWSGRGSHV